MTLIDKAEALAILAPAPNAKDGLWAKRKKALYDAIAALPARGVGVKPLEWQLCAGQDGVYYHAFDPLYGRDVEAPNEATCDAIDQNRAARILAALAPTDAATEKGGDAFEDRNPDRPNPAASPGVTAGADAAQAREAAMQELIDAYEDIMDYGIVFAKKPQQDRLNAAKEKLKETHE